MASSSRSRDILQEEWEKYRPEITSLFQTKTYDQIISHLGQKFDFHPRYARLVVYPNMAS